MHSFGHTLFRSLIHLFISSFFHSIFHSIFHSFIHSFIHSLLILMKEVKQFTHSSINYWWKRQKISFICTFIHLLLSNSSLLSPIFRLTHSLINSKFHPSFLSSLIQDFIHNPHFISLIQDFIHIPHFISFILSSFISSFRSSFLLFKGVRNKLMLVDIYNDYSFTDIEEEYYIQFPNYQYIRLKESCSFLFLWLIIPDEDIRSGEK